MEKPRSRKNFKFVDSFRSLKARFRHIYQKCTCNLDRLPSLGNPSAEPNFLGGSADNGFLKIHKDIPCASERDPHFPGSCCHHHHVAENVHFSRDDYVWIMNRETELILPSPPPTPLISHPDGDFLCKVIPPPLEFQDRSQSGSHKYHHQPFRNPCFRLTRTGSDISAGMFLHEEECCLKLPTLRTHSAITKLSRPSSSRPISQSSCFSRPKSRGGCGTNDCVYRSIQTTTQTGSCTPSPRIHSKNRSFLEKAPEIVWKDLPKSISLHINSGFVESMFIPSWTAEVLRKAPFFPVLERVINWSSIDFRHERADQRRKKILAMKHLAILNAKRVWSCRNQIGLLKRLLRNGNEYMNTVAEQELSSRFQLINWLTESGGDVNSIGRYIDVKEKQLVVVKTVADKPPSRQLDQLQLKVGALEEINALMQMAHINVVRLLSYFENQSKVHIIMEPCDHSLRCEMAFGGSGVDPAKAHEVIHQIVSGLDHCHQRRCVHRNLSPDSVLVTVAGVVKIADFSKAVFLDRTFRTPCLPTDIHYGAPELLALDPEYDVSADIWSVGCILVELLRGRLIWTENTPEEQLLLIQTTVGPLLSQHAAVALRGKHCEREVKPLHEYLPQLSETVHSAVEQCLHADPRKRITSKELLSHPFIKQSREGKKVSRVTSKHLVTLPKMALWERTNTNWDQLDGRVKSGGDGGTSRDDRSLKMKETPEQSAAEDSSLRPILKSGVVTSSKKPKATVSFSSQLVSENTNLTLPATKSCTDSNRQISVPESALIKEQLLGVGTTSFWQNLKRLSVLQGDKASLVPECQPIHQKSQRQIAGSRGNPVQADDDLNGQQSLDELLENCPLYVPSGPRSRLQYLISALPAANWHTVSLYSDHLKVAARKSPKAFAAHVESLVSVLLEQISNAKSRIAGPAIRILNNICEVKGHLFEPEAERIIECMLHKLGGPSFIEKESNEVLRQIVRILAPSKAIHLLVKYGGSHKVSAARQSTMLLMEDAVHRLNLIPELGLPGEQTAVQRRLSNALFDVATRSLKDCNTQTRMSAKNIYQQLMRHPGFWYLYQSALPEEKRLWVNRLLEEIRKHPSQVSERKRPQYNFTQLPLGKESA